MNLLEFDCDGWAALWSTPEGDAAAVSKPADWSVDEVARHLGVEADRVVRHPRRGRVSFYEWAWTYDRGDRLRELVDGTLVEKALDATAASLSVPLGALLTMAAERLRTAQGVDAPPYLVIGGGCGVAAAPGGRVPGLSVVRNVPRPEGEFDNRFLRRPALVVDVRADGQTDLEFEWKLADYDRAGVGEAWLADADEMTVSVWACGKKRLAYRADDAVPCGRLFPGLVVPVEDWLTGRLTRRAGELLAAMDAPREEAAR